MPGPLPDPYALRRDRRDDRVSWTVLPAEGRAGDPPGWPLVDVQPREWELWRELWSCPQAVMWERFAQGYEVALCVRMLARAEQSRSSIELQKVVRMYLDSLGLSVKGMLRNRWRMAEERPVLRVVEASGSRRPSVRDRVRRIDAEGVNDHG